MNNNRANAQSEDNNIKELAILLNTASKKFINKRNLEITNNSSKNRNFTIYIVNISGFRFR